MSQQQLPLLHFFKKSFNVILQANGRVLGRLHETFYCIWRIGFRLILWCIAQEAASQIKEYLKWDDMKVQKFHSSGQNLNNPIIISVVRFIKKTEVSKCSGLLWMD